MKSNWMGINENGDIVNEDGSIDEVTDDKGMIWGYNDPITRATDLAYFLWAYFVIMVKTRHKWRCCCQDCIMEYIERGIYPEK